MTEREIFNHLFEVAGLSKDPRGIVSGCLVQNDEIVLSAASADDGIRHSEDILLEKVKIKNLEITPNLVLYSTLEPCNKRSKPGMIDCTTLIINAGIKNVVFGASDPDHSEVTLKRFREAGISVRQTDDIVVIRKCAEIFNSSVTAEHIDVDVKLKPLG